MTQAGTNQSHNPVRGLRRLMYSPFLVQMVVIRKCNLACTYCNEFDAVSPPIPFDELKQRIDRVRELGAWAIEFTGGEPMLHPQMFDLISYARDLGFSKVMLLSNAFLFNAKKIEQLNEAGLTDLQVSVDGVTPNEVTVKVLKPLRKKLETIARVAKFRVTLNGVIGPTQTDEVLQVIDFAKEHGFVPRVCLIHNEDGQLNLSAEQHALYDRVGRELGKRFKEAGDYRRRIINSGAAPFRCRAGSRYLYIDEFGIVRWCSQQRDAFGVPLLEYTLANLKEQFSTHKECSPECTVGCVRTCSSPDQWRSQRLPQPAMPVVEPTATAGLSQITSRPDR